MTSKYDLQTHSTYSDGTCSPEELILLANQLNLNGLAITDHDTVLAYNESLFNFARQNHIDLITGIEVSSEYQGTSVHILGLLFDYKSIDLKKLCDEQCENRKKRNYLIADKLRKHGIHVDMDAVYASEVGSVGRVHIAKEMLRLGAVESVQEAFRSWIGDEKICYVSSIKPGLEEVINCIHKAGGVAVVAHPILIKDRELLSCILEHNFDGMECYYAKFSVHKNGEMVSLANERGMFCTGGSDFHGELKIPKVTLGCSYTDEDNMERLYECQKKYGR